ncbi:MAG: type VI secretion system lysozyme [Rhodopirellula sp. TMED11]|nr:MAG: type VI secretion system lysozyme [Rhodopirellula sp. TMED11]
MAELTAQERLFPSLLDRLTDDHRESTVESRDQKVFSIHKLRAAVLRDLAWLMNTTHIEAKTDLTPFPHVQASVINYGIPDMSGKTISGLEVNQFETVIRQSILNFEPRIIPHTLGVRGKKQSESYHGNSLTFEIEGEMWAKPFPERLFLRSELDLETGTVTIVEA